MRKPYDHAGPSLNTHSERSPRLSRRGKRANKNAGFSTGVDESLPVKARFFKVSPLLGLLTLASIVYGGICWLRLLFYRVGLLRTRRLGTLVISIGNLTAGGTGKTPLVIALAEYLLRKGLKVGVLSRGYKGQRSKDLQWVSDGQKLLASPAEVGEEPYLIALRLKDVPVVVGKDRYRSGQSLLERFKLDAIFLDDGFQHLGLHRDINLLLIDGTQPFGPPQTSGRLLPRGFLRESPWGIQRASAVLVNRMEQCHRGQEVIRQIRYYHPQAPVFQIFFRPTTLIDLASGQERDTVSLKGQSVLAFSGVGNPTSFRFFLERLGAKVVADVIFEDHHRYTFQDIKKLIQNAREEGADILVTTEKDGVKVREFLEPNNPVWALRIDLERIEDPQAWECFISEHVKIG